ncbi:MAG: LysR family transcriptional regulator, partial [Burkholderiales bacterium]|nr:LysR family transcriptional regulator [Burkholderiales bacterium]
HATAAKAVKLLGYSSESGLGRMLEEALQPPLAQWPSQLVFTAHLASVLRTMALDGRGMAWLPQDLIAPDLAAGRLVPAAPPRWHLPIEIRLYRDKGRLADAAEDFWHSVQAAGNARADALTGCGAPATPTPG